MAHVLISDKLLCTYTLTLTHPGSTKPIQWQILGEGGYGLSHSTTQCESSCHSLNAVLTHIHTNSAIAQFGNTSCQVLICPTAQPTYGQTVQWLHQHQCCWPHISLLCPYHTSTSTLPHLSNVASHVAVTATVIITAIYCHHSHQHQGATQ
jgi:hypothetical protein